MSRRLAIVVAAVALSAGCTAKDDTFSAQFAADYCQQRAIDVSRERQTAASVVCQLPKTMWMVALPAQHIAAEDLKKAGLPEDVALSLSNRHEIRAEFCLIEELPTDTRGTVPHRQFSEDHVPAKVAISSLFIAHSKSVLIAVSRDNSNVKLVGLSDNRS